MGRTAWLLVLAVITGSSGALADPLRIAPAPAPAPALSTLAPRGLEPALEARRLKMNANLKPGMRARLDKPIADVLKSAQNGKADLMATSKASLTSWSVLGSMQGADIEALAFLVLMEAAKSAQEDLKAIMAQVKAINAAKAALRAALAAMQSAAGSHKPCAKLECVDAIAPTAEMTRADLDAAKQSLQNVAEGQRAAKGAELGEMQQMRLQMFQDRQAKMNETLSNLLKKISDTSSTITSNLN